MKKSALKKKGQRLRLIDRAIVYVEQAMKLYTLDERNYRDGKKLYRKAERIEGLVGHHFKLSPVMENARKYYGFAPALIKKVEYKPGKDDLGIRCTLENDTVLE
ncbi:hypothetical protein GOV14_04665 [Candidatus Pacearchaeota archaeon]|nr:hypothetical protein [Candidatus Pacearchaeota archaeon]